jgi:multiple sugar transport system permease protein
MADLSTAGRPARAVPIWWATRSGQTRLWHSLLHLVLIALGITFLIPLLWMISTSLKSPGTELVYPPQWIPQPIAWSNYNTALVTMQPFSLYLRNTCIIAAGVTIGDVLSTSLAAYAFARLRFPGRNILFMAMLAILMLPNIVTLVPTFLLMRYLHWIDTFLPLIVPAWFGATPAGGAFSMFLFRQFFMTIPRELDEAARIDGANPIRIWWSILLPLSGPVLIAVAILDVLNTWNDFLMPLIFINSPDNFTLTLGLGEFQLAHQQALWNYMMAASVAMVLPVLVVFFFAQRYFMRGIVTSGLAGR